NSNSVVHTTHDRSVVTRLQCCDDRRLAWLSRSMQAVLNRTDLTAGDNAADHRSLPVVIRGNQSPCAVVQFQCRISQCIGNIIWRRNKLGTNGTNNHRLWSGPLHNETANHHVVASLNKAPSANIAYGWSRCTATWRDRRADPGYHFTFHLLPVVK